MGHEPANFVFGHPILQRSADMPTQLIRPVEGGQGRDGNQAAIALG
jgi:hypothetical protein